MITRIFLGVYQAPIFLPEEEVLGFSERQIFENPFEIRIKGWESLVDYNF
eukprot:gnl/Chilomastix_caulleri/4929.p1 GENE.gnl/Chilomastix_caulleri/4929~~gnl/Chilomastix_caulleri/4929.p1  ORF type:complete len:50 (+),score=3.80 gnl/Chilomastix_caulleri/4929:192-341(+)